MGDCLHGFAQNGRNCAVCVHEEGRREGYAAAVEYARKHSEGISAHSAVAREEGRREERERLLAGQRTAPQEAVLRAAVACKVDGANSVHAHRLPDLLAAVDALLAAEPAWGEGK